MIEFRIAGSPKPEGLRAVDVLPLLRENVAFLSGQYSQVIIIFPGYYSKLLGSFSNFECKKQEP